MNFQAPPTSQTAFSAQQGFIFLLSFATLLGLCLVIPRALSFLPGLAGLCGFLFLAFKNRAAPAPDKILLTFLAAFSVLSLISCFWAPDWEYSLGKSIKSTLIILSCFMLFEVSKHLPRNIAHKDMMACGGAVLCAFAGAVYSFEYVSGFMLTQFLLNMDPENLPSSIKSAFILNRSMVFLVLLCIPVLLAIYQSGLQKSTKTKILACMAIGILPALFMTQSQTAQIAAFLAVVMFMFPSHKKTARRAFAAVLLAVMIAAPFVIMPLYQSFESSPAAKINTGLLYKASIPHRLEVWNFISEKTLEKPLFGNGLEATRFLKSDQLMPRMKAHTVLHPHNAILQVWLEFGFIGILLAAGFIIYLFRLMDDKPVLMQRYYMMLFTVLLSVMSIGYGLWQAWQIGMVFAIASLSVMVNNIYGPLPEIKSDVTQG